MNRSFVSVFVERLISLQRNKEKDCGRESQAMKADMKNQQMAASSCEVPQYQDEETVIGGTMCHCRSSMQGSGEPRLSEAKKYANFDDISSFFVASATAIPIVQYEMRIVDV